MSIVTLVLIILIQILLIFLSISSIAGFQDNLLTIIGIPIHLIIVVLLNFVSLYILWNVYKREEQQKVKHAENTHVEEFRSLVASLRSDRHDLNNHLTVISGLIKIKNFETVNNYIREMIGDIRVTNQALTIKNAVLASMLYSKMDKYHRKGIPFKLNIACGEIISTLSSTDLIRLISNLLDNAYDATLELPIKERNISLEIQDLDEKLIISVKNTAFHKEINEDFFLDGYSTKSLLGNRGYGLTIIRNITDKYNGTLSVETKDHLVCFEISFCKD